MPLSFVNPETQATTIATSIAGSTVNSAINYISFPVATDDPLTNSWRTYADAAGTSPVDGTGGTANITLTRQTSSPLNSTGDFRLTKDAVNRQGQGFSTDFTIANRHLTKVLQITFDMELINGTYSAGDLRVYIIQDPSGTPVVIEPVSTNLELGIANQRVREIATFQTHVSVTSYRLCVHVSTTSASAYTVDFNNFRVWEPTQSIGSVITDWQSYTPTFTQLTISTYHRWEWRRVGGSIEIRGTATSSSNPGGAQSFTLPPGLTTLTNTSTNYSIVGNWSRNVSSTANFGNMIARNGETTIGFGGQSGGAGMLTLYNAIGGSDLFSVWVSVPIAGWGSSVAMSSDTGDSRVVGLYVQGTLTSSISADAPLTWASLTTNQDTHGAYNFSTGVYTAPIQGYYNLSGFLNTNASLNTFIRPWVNGVNRISYFSISTSSGFFNIAGGIFLNTGDQLTLRPNAAYSAVSSGSFLYISRVSASSQVIASSETVACEAVMTSSNNPGTDQPIRFNSIIRDTHSAYNTSTYRYTIPMSGWYQIGFMYNISTGGHTTDWIYLFINGTRSRSFCLITATPNTEYYPSSVTAYFLSGDIIDIRSGGSTAPNFYGDSTNNTRTRMTVHRIGI